VREGPPLDGLGRAAREAVEGYYAAGVTDPSEIFAREAESMAAEWPDNERIQQIARDGRTIADLPARDPETFARLERAVLDLQHEKRRIKIQRRLARK
jgi:hypothetical protein